MFRVGAWRVVQLQFRVRRTPSECLVVVVVDFAQPAKSVLWLTTAIPFVVGCLHSRTRVAHVKLANTARSGNKETHVPTAQWVGTRRPSKPLARFAKTIVMWKVAPDANGALQDAVQLDT